MELKNMDYKKKFDALNKIMDHYDGTDAKQLGKCREKIIKLLCESDYYAEDIKENNINFYDIVVGP